MDHALRADSPSEQRRSAERRQFRLRRVAVHPGSLCPACSHCLRNRPLRRPPMPEAAGLAWSRDSFLDVLSRFSAFIRRALIAVPVTVEPLGAHALMRSTDHEPRNASKNSEKKNRLKHPSLSFFFCLFNITLWCLLREGGDLSVTLRN